MVFAMAFDVDVSQHHDIIITLHILEGAFQHFCGIHFVTSEELSVSFCNALGGVDQTFSAWVVTGPCEQRANGIHRIFHAWSNYIFG